MRITFMLCIKKHPTKSTRIFASAHTQSLPLSTNTKNDWQAANTLSGSSWQSSWILSPGFVPGAIGSFSPPLPLASVPTHLTLFCGEPYAGDSPPFHLSPFLRVRRHLAEQIVEDLISGRELCHWTPPCPCHSTPLLPQHSRTSKHPSIQRPATGTIVNLMKDDISCGPGDVYVPTTLERAVACDHWSLHFHFHFHLHLHLHQ